MSAARAELRGLLALGALWLLAFALALQMLGEPCPQPGSALLAGLLGETRPAIGDALFLAADRTFHRGVGPTRTQVFEDFFARLRRKLQPTAHVHLHGANTREILPWLSLTLRADPHNLTAYSVTAFWLVRELDRPDLALELLQEARLANPRCYEVYLDLARLHLRTADLDKALRRLDTAAHLWPEHAHRDVPVDETQAILDWAEINSLRGIILENKGRFEDAARFYRVVLQAFPKRVAVARRLAELEADGPVSVTAETLLQSVLNGHGALCDHDDHNHDRD